MQLIMAESALLKEFAKLIVAEGAKEAGTGVNLVKGSSEAVDSCRETLVNLYLTPGKIGHTKEQWNYDIARWDLEIAELRRKAQLAPLETLGKGVTLANSAMGALAKLSDILNEQSLNDAYVNKIYGELSVLLEKESLELVRCAMDNHIQIINRLRNTHQLGCFQIRIHCANV